MKQENVELQRISSTNNPTVQIVISTMPRIVFQIKDEAPSRHLHRSSQGEFVRSRSFKESTSEPAAISTKGLKHTFS